MTEVSSTYLILYLHFSMKSIWKGYQFLSKMVHKRVMGLDFQVSPSIVLTVDYMKEINSFMPILSIRIFLSRFYQLIFFFLDFVYLNLTFTI